MNKDSSLENSSSVTIQLTSDEALVLFELLERFSNTEALSIEDQAEKRALWSLCNRLEKLLSEPFAANYQALLEQARARLCDDQG
ncbi:MAG TPA: hypothetical protein VF928_09900 [Usitatibacteraceae bacterium]